MKTDYGTTYNSYIIKGKEKTALVEASHLSFSDYYIDNVKDVVDLQKIDYLIMNHNEPDHSGAIAKLAEINPDMTVVVSQAGSIYLKNITNNPNVKYKVVRMGKPLILADVNSNLSTLLSCIGRIPCSPGCQT